MKDILLSPIKTQYNTILITKAYIRKGFKRGIVLNLKKRLSGLVKSNYVKSKLTVSSQHATEQTELADLEHIFILLIYLMETNCLHRNKIQPMSAI